MKSNLWIKSLFLAAALLAVTPLVASAADAPTATKMAGGTMYTYYNSDGSVAKTVWVSNENYAGLIK